MSKILPVTKESIFKAIEAIDKNPNLLIGRESQEYDLISNGKTYPPVLVLSEANKALGGSELTIRDFGNSTRHAFKDLKKLGFEIVLKKNPNIKEALLDMVELCQRMFDGKNNNTVSITTYTDVFRPHINVFEKKYGLSPNLFLQNELKKIFTTNILPVNENFKIKNFGFWGRSIYNYTWSCIFYDFNRGEIPASYSPQLYILANKEGIKLGFCYGQHVQDKGDLVTLALKENQLSILKKCMNADKDLCFFNSTNEEITARPEKLFGRDERIIVHSDDDIRNNWTKNSLLIKEFYKEDIPPKIGDIIQSTLSNLEDFFLSLFPINKRPLVERNSDQEEFRLGKIKTSFSSAGLKIQDEIISRFICSLLTKPFVILTGLSGSGKTKLAQAFSMWICEDENQYCIVPVGADWTNREQLLGFPNALENQNYVKPDTGVLDLIIEANRNQNKPYFVILDEMNLSHVERYFADFLSLMESKTEKGILLHTDKERMDTSNNIIPNNIHFPQNLFLIGTVNIDETTYMFSPKVLDRANVIEFRITAPEMETYLEGNTEIKLHDLKGEGKSMAESFVELAKATNLEATDTVDLKKTLLSFFVELKKCGAEFGYRSASEILRFAAIAKKIDSTWSQTEITDASIMQKLLPKVHGSRKRLVPILETLGNLCMIEKLKEGEKMEYFLNPSGDNDFSSRIKFPTSFEKIARMYKALLHNGFTSYAEA